MLIYSSTSVGLMLQEGVLWIAAWFGLCHVLHLFLNKCSSEQQEHNVFSGSLYNFKVAAEDYLTHNKLCNKQNVCIYTCWKSVCLTENKSE